MKNHSMVAALRRELEKSLPAPLTPEQITLLDQAEKLFGQAYQAGYKAAQFFGGDEWNNNACLGYAILGAKKLGYSEEQTKNLVRSIYREFDFKSIEDARTVYNQSPY
ncbi:hypothetical protein [Paenibacillus sp. 1-18]|uniref:hypothetical protein n=1 Tax=Paenibacillus sp. 1-18 TaxID=1333846 RepID=UPI00047082FE|nr:hypothetical protein [Paenibacillus sp. 1-18]